MVVGDHDVEPRGARRRDLLDRRDRAVHGHQQVGAALGEPRDRRGREAVPVVDPARQVPVDRRPDGPQRAHEDGRGGDAVDVVVAVDGDARAPAGVAEDERRGLAQAAERVERVRVGGGEERLGGRDLGQPAPHQHLREHVRDAQRGGQALGGGVVVRRDGEAGVDPGHGRRSVRSRSDGIGGSAARAGRTPGAWRLERK
jgi:hypothetical protein